MAINTKLGASTLTISSKMNENTLYLDSLKANQCKAELDKSYDAIIKEFEAISKEIKAAVAKETMTGEYATSFNAWRKKIDKQITYIKNKKRNLDTKFREDTQDILIKTLTQSVNDLTASINDLETQVEEQTKATASQAAASSATDAPTTVTDASATATEIPTVDTNVVDPSVSAAGYDTDLFSSMDL